MTYLMQEYSLSPPREFETPLYQISLIYQPTASGFCFIYHSPS